MNEYSASDACTYLGGRVSGGSVSGGRFGPGAKGKFVGPLAVTVLAEKAELAEEIDVDRAKAARQRAMERISGKEETDEFSFDRAESALKRAISRISVANRSGLD